MGDKPSHCGCKITDMIGQNQREKPVSGATDNVAYYEQDALWNRDYLQDAYYRTKVRLIQGMIPDGVRSILDVGCGNGTILNTFDSDYWLVGCDRSWSALQYLKSRPVQSSADDLPFEPCAFDLVMAHQVLEHLPEGVFRRTINELTRVSSKYLLISVPYRDRIKQLRACCTDCGCVYNVWGHLRSFDHISDIRQLFPAFELRVHAFCGRENEYMSRLSSWICQYIGGRWALDPAAICPQCSSKSQYQAGFPRRLVAGVAARLDRLIPKKKAFWWLVCLFERRDSEPSV